MPEEDQRGVQPYDTRQSDGGATRYHNFSGGFLEALLMDTPGMWAKSVALVGGRNEANVNTAMRRVREAAARSGAAGFVLHKPGAARGHFTAIRGADLSRHDPTTDGRHHFHTIDSMTAPLAAGKTTEAVTALLRAHLDAGEEVIVIGTESANGGEGTDSAGAAGDGAIDGPDDGGGAGDGEDDTADSATDSGATGDGAGAGDTGPTPSVGGPTAPADVGGPATVAATLVMDEPDEPATPAAKRARTQRGPNEGGVTPETAGPTGGGGGGEPAQDQPAAPAKRGVTAARQKLNQLIARKARGARVRPRAPAGSTEGGAADSPDEPPKKKGGRPQETGRSAEEGAADSPGEPPKKKGGRVRKGKCGGARQRAKRRERGDGGGAADGSDGGGGGEAAGGPGPGTT